MAAEWYLMNTNYDTVSGYESEDFENLATDAFNEALASSLGIDVEICNYDLSERIKTRVIIQGKVQDTKLKSMQRNIIAPIGTCKAGQYVFYKNNYWLIVGFVDDNGIYEKSVMVICNYLLTWVNKSGKVVQRWSNMSSASQYNNGETTTANYHVRSDQLMILTPDDDECLMLDTGARFIIDKRCRLYEQKIGKDVTNDTSNPVIVYRLTRSDSVLFDYQDSGHYEFLAYQDEQRDYDGYYVVDGKGYWICGKAKQADIRPDISKSLKSEIQCHSPIIYTDNIPQKFTALFYDKYENESDIEPQWSIDCDFTDKLDIQYDNKSVLISVNNSKLVNKTFKLCLNGDGYEEVSIQVLIRAFI